MPEPQSAHLHELLQQLHAELEHTTAVDAESRTILEHLKRDIQTVLNGENTASLNQRVQIAVTHFEESHPQLTLVLKQLLDHLAAV